MKFITKTSSNIDSQSIDNYLSDTGILPLLKTRDIYIAGGAILSSMSKTKINDIDLFFPCADDFWDIQNFLKKDGWVPVFTSDMAVTFNVRDGKKIQLIQHSKGIPINEILGNFDFITCQIALSYKTKKIIYAENFFELYTKREIKISRNAPELWKSLPRICKYVERGYYFSQAELFKIAISIAVTPLNTYGDLINMAIGIGYHDYENLCNTILSTGAKAADPIAPGDALDIIFNFVDTLIEQPTPIPATPVTAAPDETSSGRTRRGRMAEEMASHGRHTAASPYPSHSHTLRPGTLRTRGIIDFFEGLSNDTN